jgi:hypothetical protein
MPHFPYSIRFFQHHRIRSYRASRGLLVSQHFWPQAPIKQPALVYRVAKKALANILKLSRPAFSKDPCARASRAQRSARRFKYMANLFVIALARRHNCRAGSAFINSIRGIL